MARQDDSPKRTMTRKKFLRDSALLCAFADSKDHVDASDVEAAIRELGWKEHDSATGIYGQLREIARASGKAGHVIQIEVRSEGETEAVQTFPPGRIIVGRSPDNEIYIKSKFVSRHHAQLICDEDGCLIEDLNSTNGIFVGEKQVKKHRLRDGDIVSIGVHELVYHALQEADADSGDAEADTAIDDQPQDEASLLEEKRG